MIWKKIYERGKFYEVSNEGSVRMKKSNGEYYYYKSSIQRDGYVRSGHRSNHQWVAIAFLNHVPNGFDLVVHHKDGNRSNNNVSNLEVITQSENIKKKNIPKSSIYNYVEFMGGIGRYKVTMKAEGKCRYYGTFEKEEDAGRIAALLTEIYR